LLVLGLAVTTAQAAVEPPAIYCLKASERNGALWFKAGDGAKLAGVVLGKGTRGLVLAHTSDGSLCESLPHARRYAGAGYRVLAFDMRGYGYSARPRGLAAYRYDSDIVGAVRELRGRGAKKVVLMGASLGALAVLVAAPRVAVDGVVSLSSPAAYRGLDALAAAPKLRAASLFVAAERDRNASFDFAADARKLHGAAGAPEKRLEIVAGGDHGWHLLAARPVRDLVDSFVRARVG
jgi:alpha-beta hydrolase superfamily lysophospholipase